MEIKNIFGSYATKDLDQAESFYRDTLGLQVKRNEMGILELTVGTGFVIVYPKPDHQPADFTVMNMAVASVDRAVEELSGKGVEFIRYNEGPVRTDDKGIARDPNGPAIAWFKDPSGNFLSVLENGQ